MGTLGFYAELEKVARHQITETEAIAASAWMNANVTVNQCGLT